MIKVKSTYTLLLLLVAAMLSTRLSNRKADQGVPKKPNVPRNVDTSTWVWPPRGVGSCSCASRIREQYQQAVSVPVVESCEKRPPRPTITSSFRQPTSSPPVIHPRPLRLLFSKELTYGEIQKPNKIMLPKREAQNHLPAVKAKQATRILMDDKETRQTWPFRLRYRIGNKTRVYSLTGTRKFMQAHDLKAGDYIVIYKDDDRDRYVIEASKKIMPTTMIDYTNCGVLGKIHANSPSSYIYLNNNILSELGIQDEMEEAARPTTPYLYGNAYLPFQRLITLKLAPLPSFRLF